MAPGPALCYDSMTISAARFDLFLIQRNFYDLAVGLGDETSLQTLH